MKSLLLRLLLTAAALVPGAACAVYVFNTVDYPGAVFTDVREDNRASLALVRALGFTEAPTALQEAVQQSLARPGEATRVVAFELRLA